MENIAQCLKRKKNQQIFIYYLCMYGKLNFVSVHNERGITLKLKSKTA